MSAIGNSLSDWILLNWRHGFVRILYAERLQTRGKSSILLMTKKYNFQESSRRLQ